MDPSPPTGLVDFGVDVADDLSRDLSLPPDRWPRGVSIEPVVEGTAKEVPFVWSGLGKDLEKRLPRSRRPSSTKCGRMKV